MANARYTPYQDKNILHGPRVEDTPMPHTIEKYQRIVSDLRYLADFTRPDKKYITGRLGVSNHKPTELYWEALKATIRYLKVIKEMGILYPSGQCRPTHLRLLKC